MRKQKNQRTHFVLCLNNDGYRASLEVGKIYRVVPDEAGEAEELIRVIDESGEDYAFAADRFHPIELPLAVRQALMVASRT